MRDLSYDEHTRKDQLTSGICFSQEQAERCWPLWVTLSLFSQRAHQITHFGFRRDLLENYRDLSRESGDLCCGVETRDTSQNRRKGDRSDREPAVVIGRRT